MSVLKIKKDDGSWDVVGGVIEKPSADTTNAVKYTSQSLTDSQKSKARENINAMKSIPYGTSLPLSGEIGDIFLLIEE